MAPDLFLIGLAAVGVFVLFFSFAVVATALLSGKKEPPPPDGRMMPKVVEELRALLAIEDAFERTAAVLQWWDGLDDNGRDEVLMTVQAAATMWQHLADYLGALGNDFAEVWQKMVNDSPELQMYVEKLDEHYAASSPLYIDGGT